MMPNCEYRKCKKVAALKLGSKIGTGGDYYDDFKWEQVVYLCPKHYIEVMVLLGRDKKRAEKDVAEYNRRMAAYDAKQAEKL